MDDKRLVTISKYLSKHLRHEPARIGLTLEAGGWVRVDALLVATARSGFAISQAELEEVVARNSKQRFAFDASGERIRANQGHSVDVDLQLEPQPPPELLYHGTGERSVAAILREGLQKMARHHVHLSADIDTARTVGARHGRVAVFDVAAGAMQRAGHVFYRSDNGVWLADAVPPEFLKRRDEPAS